MANVDFAFPCTRGDANNTKSKIGKIMSERMITKLVHALAPASYIGLEKIGNNFVDLILDGYYFHCDALQTSAASNLYFYTTTGTDFPELWVENGECLFTTSQTIANTIEHEVAVADIKTLEEARAESAPFYIATTSDNTKINKIWINSTNDAYNPYVYDTDQADWIPLGAVYKA